jgi:hypothetical protein
MSLFLLTYDRRQGHLARLLEFEPGAYGPANQALLDEELAHPDMEVVLLEAATVEALKQTHGRYFGLWSIPTREPAA